MYKIFQLKALRTCKPTGVYITLSFFKIFKDHYLKTTLSKKKTTQKYPKHFVTYGYEHINLIIGMIM